jgi:hypothetical protein
MRDNQAVFEVKVGTSEGPLGLWVGPRSHLEVDQFEVEGVSQPAQFNYLYTEALLGAGESLDDWEVQQGPLYRYGIGAIHKGPGGITKWNFIGSGFKLWSPKGPSWGRVQVLLDGKEIGEVELKSDVNESSTVLLEKTRLKKGPHSLVLKAINGLMVVDSLEVIASR